MKACLKRAVIVCTVLPVKHFNKMYLGKNKKTKRKTLNSSMCVSGTDILIVGVSFSDSSKPWLT